VGFENRGGTVRFNLQEIVGQQFIEASFVDIANDQGGQVHVDYSDPVLAWERQLFLAVKLHPGVVTILRIGPERELSVFWTGRVGAMASLAFSRTADRLVLADSHQLHFIAHDGAHSSMRTSKEIDALTGLNDEIATANLRDDALTINVTGGRPESIDIDGAIRQVAGLDDRALILLDSPILGRDRLEIRQVVSQRDKRKYSLTEGPWQLVRLGRVGAVLNGRTGEILLVEELVASQLDWTPPGALVGVAWTERIDDRLVLLTSAGYSLVTPVNSGSVEPPEKQHSETGQN
jgi:hypothetical protein